MARIVTTTYRYKPPPKREGRKLAKITGPAVVTAKKSRRLFGAGEEAAAEVGMTRPSSNRRATPVWHSERRAVLTSRPTMIASLRS